MKRRLAISALFVVIFAELVGLAGLIYHRHCFNVQKESYNKLMDRCFEENEDIQQIRQLIYLHEFVVTSMLFPNPLVNTEDQRSKVVRVELQIRNQIIHHGNLLQKLPKDTEKANLFRFVNDDVLTYLNLNTVITSLIGSASTEEISTFIKSNITPLITRVDASTNALSNLSTQEMINIRNKIDVDLNRSGVISFFSILLLVCSIIISIYYTHSILNTLETDREALKIKSEQSEKKITDIQEQIIIGMADLVERRSGETGQHVKRTSRFVNMILKNAKRHNKWPQILTDDFINDVTRGAPLHDLGKIIIPDMILNKPGKLTPEEFEIMKTHAAHGGIIIHQILDGIEDKNYINIACSIATCHHEKWDGSGYPNGLKGKQIPLCARIMAVADVFDALVSERCYKKPMSYDDAFALIQREAGKHFDPEIVELFMELENEIKDNK